jgi:hemolysin III
MAKRIITMSEEIFNASLHGFGLLLSVVGTVLLVLLAIRRGGSKHVIGVSIFGATLILVYLASTLYHGLPSSWEKDLFEQIDNAAIYLLIAGTYTPITLGLLRGGWGWSLFWIEWSLAFIGVMMTIFVEPRIEWISLMLYLSMGWLILIALRPLCTNLSQKGLELLVAGGLTYSIGVIFYIFDDLPYYHAVWHTFVLAGSICHYFAILLYTIPSSIHGGDNLSSKVPTGFSFNNPV